MFWQVTNSQHRPRNVVSKQDNWCARCVDKRYWCLRRTHIMLFWHGLYTWYAWYVCICGMYVCTSGMYVRMRVDIIGSHPVQMQITVQMSSCMHVCTYIHIKLPCIHAAAHIIHEYTPYIHACIPHIQWCIHAWHIYMHTMHTCHCSYNSACRHVTYAYIHTYMPLHIS